MSKATFTFGRFNPPTEEGHGKLVSAVIDHAEKTGGKHYVFPSHSQDKKKNPLTHGDKVHAMNRLFPNANVVASGKVRTAIDAMKHLEKQGHKEVTMVVGSDRVDNFHSLLNKYRTKEYPGIKKVNVVSAGNRDPDAEGAEGMSASKLRGLVAAGKKKEFVSHYSDKALGAHIHDKVKQGMQMESTNPIGIFLLGGPGSGKDYVLKNIFSRFDLIEVQADQILNGAASELLEQNVNIVINGVSDSNKIADIQTFLEGYTFDFVHVSVTNKVSRMRNEQREQPLVETKRIDKFLKAEKLAEETGAFVFNNSINLNESSEMERVFFGSQIERLLERVVNLGLEMKANPEPKAFTVIKEKYFPPVAKHKSGLPKKYVGKLSDTTAAARKAHWKKMGKLSDSDPRAYEPAPGDKTSKTKPSKHTIAVRKMMGEQIEGDLKKPHTVENIAKKHDVTVDVINKALEHGIKVEMEHTKDKQTAQTIALAHLWEKPDYYKLLAKMEQVQPPVDHVAAEKKMERERRIRDTRVLTHQNRHIHQAAMGEAIRRVPRSGNITAVQQKRELNDAERAAFEKAKNAIATSKVQEEVIDEGAADTSLAAKAKKSGISLGKLRKVYNRGVAAWNSGHRPGTTPQQWGHARVNSYINKGKTYYTADKDLREDTDINDLFEMQLVGTDEYRKHAIAMTPGQGEIEDAFPVKSPNKKPVAVPAKKGESIVSQYTEHTNCGTPDCCGECSSNDENRGTNESSVPRSFRAIREASKKEEIDPTPTLNTKRKKSTNNPQTYNSTLGGLMVSPKHSMFEADAEKKKDFMPTPRQVPPPPGGHPVPKGYKRVRDNIAGWKLVKEEGEPELTLEEAVSYHLENKISFTENVFRPGSDMFFEMISEAKRLYSEGKYEPKDEWEKDMLDSNIGEIAEFEGQQVVLDYPIEEGLEECWSGYTQKGMKKKGDKMVPNCVPMNEEDKTNGKGIGKPWQEGGGGAVYVKVGDSVRKISFSKSGMKKRYMDPAATRSFVARHRCLTNKDKTSASYWACRWPRFFSNSGKIWW
jgi:dephospho-CoA kinase